MPKQKRSEPSSMDIWLGEDLEHYRRNKDKIKWLRFRRRFNISSLCVIFESISLRTQGCTGFEDVLLRILLFCN